MRRTRFKGGGKRGQSYEEFFGFKRRKKGRFSLFGRKRKPQGCAVLVLVLLAGVVLLAIRLGKQTELSVESKPVLADPALTAKN